MLEIGMCKMARGEMVRYMAENQTCDPERIKLFDADRSDDKMFVFIHDATGG